MNKKIIIGNAGCGKTQYIINYCINNTNKFDQLFIVTPSKKTELLFINKCKSINSQLLNNKNIKSINILFNEIYKKIFNKSCNNYNNIAYSLYKNINDINIKNIGFLKNLKFIIIHYAEELNYIQYNLISLITTKLNIKLILVGDPNQNIYNLNNNSNIYLLENNDIEYLNINFKSNINIINFCNELIPLKDYKTISNDNIQGSKPLIYYNNYNNIIQHIIHEINNNECKLHDIAIIGLYKNDLNLICTHLNSNNIKYVKFYDNIDTVQITDNYINILTCYDIKGYSFNKVLVFNYCYDTNLTFNKYNYYKYVWYHIFTRAIKKLIIYIENNKFIFPYINNISKNLYNIEGNNIKIKNINFCNIQIFKNINNFEICNKNVSSSNFNYIINKYKLYNNITNEYNIFYIKILKELFKYYYYKNNNKLDKYILENIKTLNNIIFLNDKDIYDSLINKGIIYNDIIYLNILNDTLYNNNNKNLLSESEVNFLIKCKKYNCDVIITLNNIDINNIISLYNDLLKLNNNEYIIFTILTNFYSIININYNLIEKHLYILNELSLIYKNLNFDVYIKHINLNLYGVINCIENNNKIIQFKFNPDYDINNNIIENLLYYNTLYTQNNIKIIEVIDLFNGYKYIINIINFNNWEFNYFICDLLNEKMINNVIMFDLETNTKDLNINFTEPSNCEIIDRYFYEYNWNYCFSEGFIKNKYNLTTSHITNIFENDLINADNDINIMKNNINLIFKYCYKPIFIAHNGIMFDLPILYYNNILKEDDIKILDSLKFIKLFCNNINLKSNKLIDLYNLICDNSTEQNHHAKEDTMLIINICKKLNFNINDFIYLSGY